MNQDTIKNLVFDLIDLGGTYKKFVYSLTRPDFKKSIKKNQELIDSPKKDVCYICALGPSLKDVDLSRLNGDSIVVNRFYKIGKQYPLFKPTYYMMLDAQFGNEDNIKDFNEAISSYSNGDTKFVLNVKLSSFSNRIPNFPQKPYYLAAYGGDMRGDKDYKVDGVFPAFQNVAGAAILFAITLGYKKIILLGCDFNSFATPIVYHCYENTSTKKLRPLSDELFFYSIAARQHDELRKYADRNGVEIINSTKGSLIDSYTYLIEEDIYRK